MNATDRARKLLAALHHDLQIVAHCDDPSFAWIDRETSPYMHHAARAIAELEKTIPSVRYRANAFLVREGRGWTGGAF